MPGCGRWRFLGFVEVVGGVQCGDRKNTVWADINVVERLVPLTGGLRRAAEDWSSVCDNTNPKRRVSSVEMRQTGHVKVNVTQHRVVGQRVI